ncbi:DUF3192 domain-containing protein [Gallaecimonas sp. GXIMD1310]|uniref:DUF3192 domain-containing protein n=1 Tax=Gallaecimonas sp. GXIMD1310 TaxID=3131926 RepID=UPI00324AB0E0
MSKTSFARLATLAVLILPLSACVVVADGGDGDRGDSIHHQEKENRQSIAGLQTGMTQAAVLAKMGTPAFDDQLTDGHRVLFYRTQWKHGDGATTRDECTPLIFADGKLVGWGQLALNKL